MNKSFLKKLITTIAVLCLTLATFAACGGALNEPAGGGSSESVPPAATDPEPVGSSSAPADVDMGDPVTFKLSFNGSPTSVAAQGYQLLCDKITEYSGGTVTVEFYPGGTLIAEAETMDALMAGTCDMAHLGVSYISPTIKELSVLEVPGLFRSERYMEVAYGLKDIVDDLCEPYGLKYLLPATTGQVSFPSSAGLIRQPSDMNGLNIRVSGKYQGEAVKAWGGNPVSIPIGEIAQAMERKTVDAAYAGNTTLIDSFKLYELVDDISETNIGEILVGLVMNLEKYNALSDPQKEAFVKALDEWAVFIDEGQADYYAQYLEKVEAAGKEITILTSEESQAFIDLSMDVALPQALEIAGEKGQEIVDICMKIMEEQDTTEYQMGVKPDYDWIEPGY